ncbi:ATP-binding protein [Anaeromicrobium sediminis]|uniref:(4Fe-4S)-binding protein n=1 Tax=Anaeromicrobium sediminis TaxID=1478221 RepID=A0A267MNC2_9FIRM|nr:ATP-binding protein [Anaeromicrobium sediminis]PAB60418.1 (4Fe-4S)-binding protein [Anaeromicrobium sediminis]
MQLVVISGKGGTGKTTVAASFAYLNKESIKVDCDVDASNLNIVLQGENIASSQFIGAKIAKIDKNKCIECGKCSEVCRFGAIKNNKIIELKCEGCAACKAVCPVDAITLEDEVTGETIITKTDAGILSRAEMVVGAEGSGKLVTEVRKNAMEYRKNNELMILDGTPGIGCAVMASITGCDVALIVIEPTQSGLNDFKRILSLIDHFGVKPLACINKYDINEDMTLEIQKYCENESVEVLGKIPFDPIVQKAVNELKPVICYEDSIAGKEIKNIWENIYKKYKEGIL